MACVEGLGHKSKRLLTNIGKKIVSLLDKVFVFSFWCPVGGYRIDTASVDVGALKKGTATKNIGHRQFAKLEIWFLARQIRRCDYAA